MFRCICGKEFLREGDLRKHILDITKGIVSYCGGDEHAAVKVDLDVRKIFQEMPRVTEFTFQEIKKQRINQIPVKRKNSRKYGKSKCIKCGNNPALADNGGLCKDCGKGFSNPQFNGGYACNG